MPDREKVFDALRNCITEPKCRNCPWEDCERFECKRTDIPISLGLDILKLLKEQEEERKRLLSWFGKFCRHIDNGDKWLTDEENIAFFREKMKQQFGWFCADGEVKE